MTDSSDLFEQARQAVRVSDVAGVKLARTQTRVGEILRGGCPVCKAGEGKLKDGPFWVDDAKGRWGCFAGQGDCQRGGDVVTLEHLLRGGNPREIAERFAGTDFVARHRAEIAVKADRPRRAEPSEVRSDAAARLRRDSRPALPGGLVDLYLSARGLGEAVRAVMRAELRYHPEAFYDLVPAGAKAPSGGRLVPLSGRRTGLLLPAQLAEVRTPEGRTGGVHLTFLRGDGGAKARVKRPKKMLGPQMGRGRAGGALLSPMTGEWAARPLIVGEGIETVGSAAELFWRREGVVPRMAAALSLDRLSGGWASDDRGRYDPDAPRPDEGRPPFTWPEAGDVLIAVDRDMSRVEAPVRGPGGRTVKRWLDSDARARVCGALACAGWRAAGAATARVISPPAGMDFNDFLREGAR